MDLCPSCQKLLTILGSITIINPAGNEETFTYYQCSNDKKYFVHMIEDVFMTDEIFESKEEIGSEKAEADLSLIKSCPKPDKKSCPCKAHTSGYRYG